MYFVIKINKHPEQFNPIIEKKVRFSDKLDYYNILSENDSIASFNNNDVLSSTLMNDNNTIPTSINDNNNGISNTPLLENNTNITDPKGISFYSNTWYGNYYLENSNDTELKNIYNKEVSDFDTDTKNKKKTSNKINLNPIPDDEKKIDLELTKSNTTIKDVYNSYTNNFKDYDKKKIIDTERKILNGASNLTYFSPDTWIYENENVINGGYISNGLTGYDEMSLNDTAIF